MQIHDVHDPLVATYVVAACLMILKVIAMSWLTVARMIGENGGFRAPEDIRKTPMNPSPGPAQLAPNEKVERIRRIQLNDLESVPFFLVAGFLYILTAPSLMAARIVLYGYVASRLLHFAAYLSGQSHEIRATFWSIGSLLLIFMTLSSLVASAGSAFN